VEPPLTHAGASDPVIAGVEDCRASVHLKLKDRFDQAVRNGELPPRADTDALARFYSIIIQGLALDAQHGATRQQLLRAVDIALAAWPGPHR
jgi:TetR/AcrR family transcriptional regulator, copper-responsive repressor